MHNHPPPTQASQAGPCARPTGLGLPYGELRWSRLTTSAGPHHILQTKRRFHDNLISEQKVVGGQNSAKYQNGVGARAYQRIPA